MIKRNYATGTADTCSEHKEKVNEQMTAFPFFQLEKMVTFAIKVFVFCFVF